MGSMWDRRPLWIGDLETWTPTLFLLTQTEGDYHLKSQAGRWDAGTQGWVKDDVTSPCIDAGDPDADYGDELWPHGQRLNMGAYGGTSEASLSLSTRGMVPISMTTG